MTTTTYEPERMLGMRDLAAALGEPLGTVKRRVLRDRKLLLGLTPAEQAAIVAERGLHTPPPDVVVGLGDPVSALGWGASTVALWAVSHRDRAHDLAFWLDRRAAR